MLNPRRSGTFTLSAAAAGYAAAQIDGLRVDYDECGQSSGQQWLTITLTPQ
jgi:hypothetical protein